MTGTIPKELAEPKLLSELVLGENELDGEKKRRERERDSIERLARCRSDVKIRRRK